MIEEVNRKEINSDLQPEPGCSELTFIGSQGDVTALVGMMLSKLGRELSRDNSVVASSHLFTTSGVDIGNDDLREWDFYFDPDICLRENFDAYDVKIAPQAFRQLQAWVWQSEEIYGPLVETGGYIFGERNDAAQIIWGLRFRGRRQTARPAPMDLYAGPKGWPRHRRISPALAEGPSDS